MSPTSLEPVLPESETNFNTMLKLLNSNVRRLCSHLRWSICRRRRSRVVVKRCIKPNPHTKTEADHEPSSNHQNDPKRIRIATFNAAVFSMAPAVPKANKVTDFIDENGDGMNIGRDVDFVLGAKSANDRPKSILKQSPLHSNLTNDTESLSKQQKFAKSRLRVSINLPDNEISLLRTRQLSSSEYGTEVSSGTNVVSSMKGKTPLRSLVSFHPSNEGSDLNAESYRISKTVLDVLREVDADLLALQDVKAEEENAMKPLSDLARALGMHYVFAESWAPEYGNAVFSRWPIKRWKVQKIFDDTDFRNVLKATIDVPQVGDINFYCTHLDYLDENWRMKQINAIIQSNSEPHILVGGLNSLDETDYSQERWTDILKYYKEVGKPTPKIDVMRNLKSQQYIDAKDFSGECESVVMISKGQSVQGTCKYGTRVDYILSSPNSPYQFVPGSYSVLSSKGTSDHHIVKVDIVKVTSNTQDNNAMKKRRQQRRRVVKITGSSPSKGIWKTNT